MDRRDEEMRETIRKLWPVQGKKMMDLLMPPSDELDEGKMSVGKIYAGLLISENWKAYKASQNASNNFKMNHNEKVTNILLLLQLSPRQWKRSGKLEI
ncbi:voltage-dependent calcium channel type A subunit alpha-1-like isoform X2 [Aplysia californica]|uniref:Voltage-dependent calcium channel type A subunit alpha-1-like isoform X2 n=1 Tax=Aplysia californica TaxID=6500 RepID=A0ABM1VXX9_APLCA|nr:voltage-dependent calcium channel type A subunit alpha-1-like isoform X2 [Aplysia californica]